MLDLSVGTVEYVLHEVVERSFSRKVSMYVNEGISIPAILLLGYGQVVSQ